MYGGGGAAPQFVPDTGVTLPGMLAGDPMVKNPGLFQQMMRGY